MRARPWSFPARKSRSPTQAQMDVGPEGARRTDGQMCSPSEAAGRSVRTEVRWNQREAFLLCQMPHCISEGAAVWAGVLLMASVYQLSQCQAGLTVIIFLI